MKPPADRLRRSRGRPAASAKPARGPRFAADVPLDAEDVALASLEASVRAEEARVGVETPEVWATLRVRLPRGVVAALRAQAARARMTASQVIERALAQYLAANRAARRPAPRRRGPAPSPRRSRRR